jgi:pyruvate/2-oxoglutarate dehydrogenase complex dihydrolipoamide dehydrogenase (E3) component
VEGRSGEDVHLRVRTAGGEQTIAGSDILAATGRTPNTAGIGLDVAGVELDERGYVMVNDRLETSAADAAVPTHKRVPGGDGRGVPGC